MNKPDKADRLLRDHTITQAMHQAWCAFHIDKLNTEEIRVKYRHNPALNTEAKVCQALDVVRTRMMESSST